MGWITKTDKGDIVLNYDSCYDTEEYLTPEEALGLAGELEGAALERGKTQHDELVSDKALLLEALEKIASFDFDTADEWVDADVVFDIQDIARDALKEEKCRRDMLA